MATECLHQIIAVENELHAQEEAEQARAVQWLGEQEKALRAGLARQRAELAAAVEAARGQARAKAEREAAEKLRAAEQLARQLSGTDDALLRQILARHLQAMVEGRLP